MPDVAVVVLDVAGAAVGDRRHRLHRLDRLRALELGEDRLQRAAEGVGEDAEPAAVGHPEHDLLRRRRAGPASRSRRASGRSRRGPRSRTSSGPGRPSRGSARTGRPRSGAAAAPCAPRRRAAGGGRRSRSSRAATSAAGARRGARSGSPSCRSRPSRIRGSASSRVSPGHPDAQDRGRDLRHQLRGQVEVLGLDRRVALRLGAERVEVGREVAVGAVGLEQRGRGLHRLQQLLARAAPRPPARRARAPPSGGAEAEAGWAVATIASSRPRSRATDS